MGSCSSSEAESKRSQSHGSSPNSPPPRKKLNESDNEELNNVLTSLKTNQPTALGGKKDISQYKVPDGRETLVVSQEGLTEWPTFLNVQHVKRLDLSHNRIKNIGNDVSTTWSSLDTLNVSYNTFKDVPGVLKTLPNLTTLDMSGNPVRTPKTRTSVVESCGAIAHMKSLSTLLLRECRLDNIPKGVVRSHSITDLDLSNNQSISLGRTDGTGIQSITTLTKLKLIACQYRIIPEPIRDCHSLATLNLSENQIFDFAPLASVPSLESLILSGCQLKLVPHVIAELPQLQHLDVSNNPGIDNWKALLKGTATIKNLVARNCGLTSFPVDWLESKTITSLDVAGNDLSYEALTPLPQSILGKNIEELFLVGNPVTFEPSYRSFDAIVKLPNLKHFSYERWADKKESPQEKSVIYRNRIPAQLCALPLVSLNGVTLKEGLFSPSGSIPKSFKSLLNDGTLKIDIGVEWEHETCLHVDLMKTLSACREFITKDLEISVERYQFYLKYILGSRTPELHPNPNGDESIVPPLDVLFLLYAHVTNPASFAKDMADNNIRIVGHLPYPQVLDYPDFFDPITRSEADIQKPGTPYQISSELWDSEVEAYNQTHKGKNPNPRLSYSWFVKREGPQPKNAVPVCDVDVECSLDLLQEAPRSLAFIDEITAYSNDLIINWHLSRERYLRYFCLNICEPGSVFLPSMGIQGTARVHQCLPKQYKYTVDTYAKGQHMNLELPVNEPDLQYMLDETNAAWKTHFSEEYMTKLAGDANTILAHSPRSPHLGPSRKHSNNVLGTSLKKPHTGDKLKPPGVRFMQGATGSNIRLQ